MRWIRRSVLLQQTLSHMPSHVRPGEQERKEYEDKANEAKVNASEYAPARGMCFSDSPLHESSLHSIGVILASYFFFGESRVCLALTWYICAALCAGTISGREEGLACAASRRDDRHVAGVGRPPPTALVLYQTLSSHAGVARLLASAHELSKASFHASVYRYVCLGKPVFECVYGASKLLMGGFPS